MKKLILYCRLIYYIAIAASSVLLALSLGFIFPHIPGWVKTGDVILAKAQTTMGSVANAADTANDTSTQMLDLVGSATKLVDHTTVTVDKLNGVIDKSNTTVDKLNVFAEHTTADLDSMTSSTNTALFTLNSSVGDISKQLQFTFNQIPPTLIAGQNSLTSLSRFVDGPLTDTMGDVEGFLTPADLFMTDAQIKAHQYWFPGKISKKRMLFNVGVGLFQESEPAYYLYNLLKGK